MRRGLFLFLSVISCYAHAQQRSDFHATGWSFAQPFGGGPRDDGSAFSLNGKGYYGCGADLSFTVRNDWWAYDPQADQWSETSSLPGSARQYAVAFSSSAFGYLVGGILGDGSFSNEVFRFDPEHATWAKLSNAPFSPRAKAAGFKLGDVYYLGTGIGDSLIFNDFWMFDLNTESWSRLGDLPFDPRNEMVGFSANGFGYLLLGQDSLSFYNEMWKYDPVEGSWQPTQGYPGLARTFSAAVAEPGGAVVAGGMNEAGELLSEAYHFDARKGEWSALPDLTRPNVRGMDGFRLANQIYFIGGLTSFFTRLNAVQRLTYADDRNEMRLHVWPVPARDKLRLTLESEHVGDVRVEIFDISGDRIHRTTLDQQSVFNWIDVHALKDGIYYLRATTSEVVFSAQTFLIQN